MIANDKTLGCLILHGFTSSLDTVNGLVPRMERNNIPYRMPVLRGHCTRPEDLVGVTWKDWYADAQAALQDLLEEVDLAIPIGLSMGGLVALNLAMDHGEKLAGVVAVAAALRFKSPLIGLLPLLSRLFQWWKSPPAFADAQCAKRNTNYGRFPTRSFVSLYEYSRLIESRLPRVTVPLLIVQSHRDTVVDPASAQAIFDRVSSREKRIAWFEKTDHEMLMDLEREAVFDAIEGFVLERRP
ncbi:MAG: alpha/beta fold hydrolase [Chloroflexota bacterium]